MLLSIKFFQLLIIGLMVFITEANGVGIVRLSILVGTFTRTGNQDHPNISTEGRDIA